MTCFRFLILAPLCGMAYAGPPLITDDPDTPERGHWEINVAATVEKRGSTWGVETPLLDINYGLTDSIQLKFEAPFLQQFEEGGDHHGGLGNAEFGVKWRFLDQEDIGVSVSTYPQIGLNVSSHSVSRGLLEDGWEFVLPLEIQREFDDRTTVFGELGYIANEYGGNGLLWGLAVDRKLTDTFSILAEIAGESASNFKEAEWVANVGIHWQMTEGVALISSIGKGLNETEEPQAKVLGYLGLQFTF